MLCLWLDELRLTRNFCFMITFIKLRITCHPNFTKRKSCSNKKNVKETNLNTSDYTVTYFLLYYFYTIFVFPFFLSCLDSNWWGWSGIWMRDLGARAVEKHLRKCGCSWTAVREWGSEVIVWDSQEGSVKGRREIYRRAYMLIWVSRWTAEVLLDIHVKVW